MLDVYFKIIFALWIIFGIYWVATRFSVKKTLKNYDTVLAFIGEIPTYIIGGFVLIALFAPLKIVNFFTAYSFLKNPILFGIIGVILNIIGVSGAIWARRTIGRNWTSYIDLKEDHELIKTGPYKFVRHPIYTGMFLMSLGVSIQVGSLVFLVLAPLCLAGFCLKARREEKVMIKHFGKKYLNYMKNTKMIIPLIL